MLSPGFALYEIIEINKLSSCHRTDTDRLGRGIYKVGVLVGYWGLSRNMTIPRQTSLGEVVGKKKGEAQPKPRPVSPSRPRREADLELLRALRAKGYGYKRIAGEYTMPPVSTSATPQ